MAEKRRQFSATQPCGPLPGLRRGLRRGTMPRSQARGVVVGGIELYAVVRVEHNVDQPVADALGNVDQGLIGRRTGLHMHRCGT